MRRKIGICRALYSFYHYPLWHKFFEEIGCEIILSPPTTRKIIEQGVLIAPDEICLPIKAYLGHIKYLIDKVDYILVPRMVCAHTHHIEFNFQNSLKFGCPKAIGLPDIVKSLFNEAKIIDLTIDERLKTQKESYFEVAKNFVKGNYLINQAWDKALQEQQNYEDMLLKGANPSQAFSKNILATTIVNSQNHLPQVSLVGHPYLIFDDGISLTLPKEISKFGVKVLPITSVSKNIVNDEIKNISGVHWLYERDIIGSTAYFLRHNIVSGLIFAFSFSCGTSAVVSEIIRKELLDFYDIPTITLLFDEHTATVGLLTRIESFIDLLTRKSKKMNVNKIF